MPTIAWSPESGCLRADGIQGPLTVGGTVINALTISDQNKVFSGLVPAMYTVTATTVQSSFSALITYSSTAALVVNTGVSTASSYGSLALNGGGGANTLGVYDQSGSAVVSQAPSGAGTGQVNAAR